MSYMRYDTVSVTTQKCMTSDNFCTIIRYGFQNLRGFVDFLPSIIVILAGVFIVFLAEVLRFN